MIKLTVTAVVAVFLVTVYNKMLTDIHEFADMSAITELFCLKYYF